MVNITLENVDNFSLKENLIMIDSIEILTCTHIPNGSLKFLY